MQDNKRVGNKHYDTSLCLPIKHFEQIKASKMYVIIKQGHVIKATFEITM